MGTPGPHQDGRLGTGPRPHPRQRHPPWRDRHPVHHRARRRQRRPISDFSSAEPFAIPRLGEPADITRALLFLTSDEASFATGSEFVIDGGLLLGPALKSEGA
ncbi:SDR family oxidoreductase [Streptomyces rhizosphaericola]|uniref:SDR family oxidoreductase n=1 Tax=Streptomyces rhizosphaericola TaxID=2564098 RepID=UPI0039F01459